MYHASKLLLGESNLRMAVERCYASGCQAMEQGDSDLAARLFGMMAVAAPRDERGWLGLAQLREHCGELSTAAGLLQLGAVLAAKPAHCHLKRAKVLRDAGRNQAADRSLDEAESADDDAEFGAAIEQERSRS